MTQIQRIDYLIDYLLKEGNYKEQIPSNEVEKRQLLRALVNVRSAKPIPEEILKIEDEYLQTELKDKKVTTLSELKLLKNSFIYGKEILQL